MTTFQMNITEFNVCTMYHPQCSLYSKKDIKCAKKQEKLIIIKVKGIQYIQTMGPPR